MRQYLDMAKGIFFQYAIPETHTITANEVPDLLSATYESLGRSGYRPNA